jgi:condensin-2 complex subunit H2
MPGTMATVFVNGIEREAVVTRPDESIRIHPGGQSPRNSINNNESINEFGAMDQDYDNDNDGVGFEMYDNNENCSSNNNSREDFEETTVDDATVDACNRTQTEDEIPKQKSMPKPVIDPWACLDPHEPTKADLKPRPIRIGVSYVLPAGLDGPPSDEVNGSRTKRKVSGKKKTTSSPKSVVEEPVADPLKDRPYIADLYYKSFMGDEEASKLLSKADDFYKDEFAYIRKAHEKERDANKRRQRKLGNDDVEDMAPKTGVEKYFDDLEDDDGNDGEEYYDNGNGFDYGGDNDDDHSSGRPRSNVDFDAIFPSFASRGGYEDDDDDYDSRHDYDEDDISLGGPKTFEELCRAHLRKFAKSAEIYAAETQLTRRVGKWQEGLAPLLEAQEERPEFDIHETGRQILEKMELCINAKKRTSSGEMKLASSNIVNFSTIVPENSEEYELCRLFLSTLMLCNTRNIAVKKSEDGEHVESIESFDIELLNSEFMTPMDVSFIDPSTSHVHMENAATSNLGMIYENDDNVADD